jgi:hypothetical protein
MEQVHQDVGRKITTTSTSEEGGGGLSSKSTDRNEEDPDLSHGNKGRGTSNTAQLATAPESTTLQANKDKAMPVEGHASDREKSVLENV